MLPFFDGGSSRGQGGEPSGYPSVRASVWSRGLSIDLVEFDQLSMGQGD
jgi:hypothetical protein